LIPVEDFLAPVAGHPDLTQFRCDFTLTGKALEDGTSGTTIVEQDNGDLIIEGWAAVFEGEDRQNENFAPGAFQRGIKNFVDGQSSLCHMHKHDQVLGKVLSLQEETKGLKMTARVDGAIKSHPTLGTIYHQIKNESINALSVGGFFKRAMIEGKQKIVDMDFTEISCTAVPVHSGTHFSVIAGKALMSVAPEEEVEAPLGDLAAVFEHITALTEKFGNLAGEKALPDAHNPSAANHVADMLSHLSRARAAASNAAQHSDHTGVKNAASAAETDLIAHEKKMHTLAAKVGPLPPQY